MKRKKKTKQNIEYWKPRQVIPQDNEDFEDKHEDQNEESEQDADKRNQGYQHSSLQNQYWSWRLEYYSFLFWIIHCMTIKVRTENYNTQVSNSNIGFGDLNVDILDFFYRRLARFLRFGLRACLRSLRYLEEWLGEVFNTQCSVLSSFSSSYSIFNIEKFMW